MLSKATCERQKRKLQIDTHRDTLISTWSYEPNLDQVRVWPSAYIVKRESATLSIKNSKQKTNLDIH